MGMIDLDAQIEKIIASGQPIARGHEDIVDEIKQLISDVLDEYEHQLIDTAVGETSSSFDDQIRYTITNKTMHDARKKLGL